MGDQKREYFASVSRTGHEEQFSAWVRDRKSVFRKRLYRFCDQVRDGKRFTPIPRTFGGSIVRRWMSEGLPSEAERAGLGAKADYKRVWVPKEEVGEAKCEWTDVAPWETLFEVNYEQFVLGNVGADSARAREVTV